MDHEELEGGRCLSPLIINPVTKVEVHAQLHDPPALLPRKIPCAHQIGYWVGPTARLDVMEKIKHSPCPESSHLIAESNTYNHYRGPYYYFIIIIIIIITIIIIISIIIIIISFIQGIYTYIPETKYVPREYRVAAILLLLFMVLISLVSVLNLLYFYISTFRSMCAVSNMAVFWSSFTACFPDMFLTYFLMTLK